MENSRRKTYKTISPERLDMIVNEVCESNRLLVSSFYASCLLQVDESTVYRMCSAGKLKAVKVGRNWRINRDALLKFAGLN